MVKSKEINVDEREVIWSAIQERVIYAAKVIIETLLLTERAEWLQAQPYERREVRKGHRNGKYKRTLRRYNRISIS